MGEPDIIILIVDDKTANIFALEKLLERPKLNFLTATNGKEGLKIALEKDVDLIILDVQMPEMDGFEVAQVLKSHKRTRDIPIIFASAEKKERQSIMKGFEEGAVDYLSKPLDPELTKAKVSVLLKIQMQKRELLEKNQSLEKAETKILQLNTDLQNNLQQLESVNKELESFTYSVSHDLRAPLRSLIGYSKMLEEDFKDKLGESGTNTLNIICQNASRMNKLIDDLLEFSKLGRKEVHRSEVNSDKLVKDILHEIAESTKHKASIQVKSLYPVKADPALLRQVWVNLISNAVKYSSLTEAPMIEIASYKESGELVFYVKDNGDGFDMKYVDKLFGVFQRLHKSTEFEGTGVGLALVQRIVFKHGGHVWAEGKVKQGATFYFSLPGCTPKDDQN
jgi:two-component system, sensor histidine kinase and response regulator